MGSECMLARAVRRMATSAGPVQAGIQARLAEAFEPSFLEVINESSNHNVPKGSESHFKVVVVSTKFDGQKLIDRHRSVNNVLSKELAGEAVEGAPAVHALSIVAKTPEQW